MPSQFSTLYVCSKCDAQFSKWQGRCQECGAWGTLTEQVVNKKSANWRKETPTLSPATVINFSDVRGQEAPRLKTNINEFDRALGNGIVLGSLTLLGGDPGIGKSTLLLQVADSLINGKVLYISGEESAEQIKLRLDRLKLKATNLQFLPETNIEIITATIAGLKPILAIIDSIQTMSSSAVSSEAGSVSQTKAGTAKLMEAAKQNNIPILIIGHVTKEGKVAGPKTLEHLVDAVLYLEGDKHHGFRILRSVKNRFGSTDEVGIFDMQEGGLVEVKNPSEAFLKNRIKQAPGSVVTCVMEGARPILVEVQALVSRTSFGYPQRRAVGFDVNRLQQLIAVLIKRCGLQLQTFDIHFNVVGGLQIKEPAADLAVATAIVSALKNKSLPNVAVFGEVGLAGEVRPVTKTEQRTKEAQKMGFQKVIAPPSIKNLEEMVKIFQ